MLRLARPTRPSDSPVRLAWPTRAPRSCAGYANECGEAFRPLVPVELVYFTYFLAISYVLADTVVRVRGRGRASPGPTPSPRREDKGWKGAADHTPSPGQVDKGRKGAAAPGQDSVLRATFGAKPHPHLTLTLT